MAESSPLAKHDFQSGDVNDALQFLKRIRAELRTICKVRIWTDHFRVYDVNGDSFEILNLGYPDPEIVTILDAVNTVYKRDTIHTAPESADENHFKEFKTGRRYAWAADRVM